MAILNINDDEYFKMEGINSTSLKLFIQDPIAYYNKYILKAIPFKSSEAMIFGSALHCYVLQPELFHERYVVKPDNIDLRNKDGKTWKQEQSTKNIISKDDLKLIEAMADRCVGVIPSKWHNSLQYKEIAITMPYNENWIKGKVDLLLEFEDWIINVDLKTTTDLSDYAISRTIINFGYDIQGQLYKRLIEYNYNKQCQTFLLFTSKDTANARLINIDAFVNACEDKVSKGIDDLLFSLETGLYTSPYENITFLDIPEYLKR